LKWSDVNLSRRTITVQAAYAKSGQARVVPMSSAVHAALLHLKSGATTDYVFTTRGGNRMIRFASGLHRPVPVPVWTSGVDLRMVQKLGGWSSLRMLERYGHVSANRKAQAVETLVEAFHSGFHNTPENTVTAKP
jgi:integrase